jgi:hypothetical protein
MRFINAVFVYQQFFFFKSVLKRVSIFFYLILSEPSGIIFRLRPPVKMVNFHGEVSFISVFDGIIEA